VPRADGVRRSARAAESARLEIVCGETHRGFKSHLLRGDVEAAGDPQPVTRRLPYGERMGDAEAMRIALEEAAAAAAHGDVPVGAVVVVDGRVIAARHNEREMSRDPTAHAELLAVRDAAASVGAWRLSGATVVSTLEPCVMCAGALVAARVKRLVFGAADPKAGACGSRYNVCVDPRLNHQVEVTPGLMAAEATHLLVGFFAAQRDP
jgi:tRNA(adenine34) deaminase